MNTKTEIRTEYAGFGKTPDGKWERITPIYDSPTNAFEILARFVYCADKFNAPFPYNDYKVQQRTVTTTTEEWGDV